MNVLHTFSGSPLRSRDMLARCLASLAPGDSLLLLEDGVYGALEHDGQSARVIQWPADNELYVLSEDLAARGISAKIRPVFSRVTYREFVSLCLTHSKVVNWS